MTASTGHRARDGSAGSETGRRVGAVLVGLALLLAAASLSRTLDGPWQRSWLGHNGARYAHIARNHARHGLLHLRGAPLLDAGRHDPARPDVYAHHPPGLGMALALVSSGDAGPDERTCRLFAIASTLLGLLLFASLVGAVAGPLTAGVATLVTASMPMVSVYGAHVDVQGPPVLCLSLAVVWSYRRWLAGGALWPFVLAAVGASSFDWYGLYAPAACALHLFATRPARRRTAWLWALGTGVLFAAWLGWLVSLPTMSFGRLLGAAGVRGVGALLASEASVTAGVATWLGETTDLMPAWPVLLLLALSLMLSRRTAEMHRVGPASPELGSRERGDPGLGVRGLLALLMLPPVVHGLIFPAGMLVHDYWLFGLPCGLGLAVAVGLRPLRPFLTALALVVFLVAGESAAGQVLDPARSDAIPAAVGAALARETGPEDVVLTNYDVNPIHPEVPAGYVLKYPEVTYYSDRLVRGSIDSVSALDEVALVRYPAARWFLLMPPGGPRAGDHPQLRAALERSGAPRQLSGEPEVWLYRLGQ